jgi:hypothetical protein
VRCSFSNRLVCRVEESSCQSAIVIFLSINAGFPIDVGKRFGAEDRL